jgi:hypothetical protein
VDKFTGDGIMAVFDAPVAMEDHAVRACRAAPGIQDATARLQVADRKDRGSSSGGHDGVAGIEQLPGQHAVAWVGWRRRLTVSQCQVVASSNNGSVRVSGSGTLRTAEQSR